MHIFLTNYLDSLFNSRSANFFHRESKWKAVFPKLAASKKKNLCSYVFKMQIFNLHPRPTELDFNREGTCNLDFYQVIVSSYMPTNLKYTCIWKTENFF